MTALSDSLQSFYKRVGNRIVFQNEMSLNELAWEMWERSSYKGMDPSVLSRILKGERLFSPYQLEVFCMILKISKFDRKLLKQKLFSDLSSRFGLNQDFYDKPREGFINLLEEDLKILKFLREKDSPVIVVDWIEKLLEEFHNIYSFISSRDNEKKLLNFLANLLLIQQKCILASNPPTKGYLLVKRKSFEIIKIGKKLNNNDLIGSSFACLGNSLYNDKKYEKCIKYLLKASMLMSTNFQNSIAGVPLRLAALSMAYLNKKTEYEKIKNSLLSNLSSYSCDLQGEILEGLGRSEALLKKPRESEKMILASKAALNNNIKYNGRYQILRKIQLARTEVESAIYLRQKTNLDYIQKVGREGVKLAEEFSYIKHGKNLKDLMIKVLN